MGKQHGLGIQTNQEGKKQFGLWDSGQPVRWFDKQLVHIVNAGKYDYYTSLSDTTHCSGEHTFEKPAGWDAAMEQI